MSDNQTAICERASAVGSSFAIVSKVLKNASSPIISYSAVVASIASTPTGNGSAINSANFATCSSVSGSAQVPSDKLVAHFSNS